jgi:hypothetical protein
LFHGLGSGKTCSAIGVCEEMRDYLKQMGINKRIIIVASPNVQDNFKLQLFDDRKLKEVDGIWTMKGCLGNKLLKEINPTGMKGLKREKIIQQVKNLINASYSFQGYVQFSNEIVRKSGRANDSMETKIRNLEIEYSNSLVVIDEAQNLTDTQMELLLTRICHGSKMIFCGDAAQIDLKDRKSSGFDVVCKHMKDVPGFEVITLEKNHRHEIVEFILDVYKNLRA